MHWIRCSDNLKGQWSGFLLQLCQRVTEYIANIKTRYITTLRANEGMCASSMLITELLPVVIGVACRMQRKQRYVTKKNKQTNKFSRRGLGPRQYHFEGRCSTYGRSFHIQGRLGSESDERSHSTQTAKPRPLFGKKVFLLCLITVWSNCCLLTKYFIVHAGHVTNSQCLAEATFSCDYFLR